MNCKYEWEPCNYPPAPGRAYCGPHLTPPHPHGIGHGQPTRHRPDHTPTYYDLECDTCQATWVGPIYEACIWCETALEHQQAWQAELTLTPPDIDPDDEHYADTMRTWAQRLARAVESELVTRTQADAAWKRAIK